jgi:hypothetical protein
METIQPCSGEESWWGESAAIFADRVDMVLSIGKASYNVIVCVRGANNVAQTLARECISNKLSYNCIDEPPSFVSESSWVVIPMR